jgi:hypothetical protein
MALQASGPIKFSDITTEFGTPPGRNLGDYRVSQTIGDLTRPLDDGIPISGTISFSNFYSKRLNIVVNCGSGSRIVARSRYDDNIGITTIGGFRRRPSSSSGKKVWIHTNETIGSNIVASSAPNREYCSLITGEWESNTDLRLDIGTSGVVSGAGGDGGRGGNSYYNSCERGQPGRFGTSAIGVNYQPIIITNRGSIQGGTGGGGGGGVGFGHNHKRRGRSVHCLGPGGGGGGGLGSPGGSGGRAGASGSENRSTTSRNATAGLDGNINQNGKGGVGKIASGDEVYVQGGDGGPGGSGGGNGIGSGADTRCSSPGGQPGASGFGIIIANDGSGVSISGNARIGGDSPPNTSIS